MRHHYVRHFAGNPRHARADHRQTHLGPVEGDGAGIEVRRHQRVGVVFAEELRRLAFLPRVPNRVHHADVLAHSRCWRCPRTTEAAFVVAFHLAAEAEAEATAGKVLQIPGFHRQDHRAARKGDGDGGLQADALGRRGSHRHRQHRIVRQFAASDGVEAVVLRRFRLFRDGFRPTANARDDLHASLPSFVSIARYRAVNCSHSDHTPTVRERIRIIRPSTTKRTQEWPSEHISSSAAFRSDPPPATIWISCASNCCANFTTTATQPPLATASSMWRRRCRAWT